MKIVIPPSFRQLRSAVPFDSVSLGYATVHLHPFAELSAAQQGYGVVPDGEETDWDSAWVVIGYEDCTGDPIFIDTDDEDFPVYTAAHGMGEWSPQLIAFSFHHFFGILQQVQRVARGRGTPVALEGNPISDAEREEVISFIRRNNPDISMTFWVAWLEQPE